VGTSREKIRSEGGGFRSGTSGCGGQDTRESKKEREWHKMELPLTELEQPTLDDHTAWYLLPPGQGTSYSSILQVWPVDKWKV
jgi:hypothetical protein